MRDPTSKEAFHIEAQAEHGQIELTSLDPRTNNTRDEQQQRYRPPLGLEFTGYHLLNIAVILGFGISKAVLSYHGQSVIPTTQELVGGTLFAAISYYLGMFKDQRPEIWPLFFRVDWAPPILEFLLRSEVYLFLLSLLPLRAGVESLQVALDVRRRAQLEGHVSGSSTTVKIVLVVAVVVVIQYGFVTLRQLTKVLHFGALHRLLAHYLTSTILFLVWFTVMLKPVALAFDYEADDAFTFLVPAQEHIEGDHFDTGMATVHIFLLLSEFDVFTTNHDRFYVVWRCGGAAAFFLAWEILEDDHNPHYVLYMCGMTVFLLLRMMATFPITWRSFIAGMSKIFETVYGAVRSAGSRV